MRDPFQGCENLSRFVCAGRLLVAAETQERRL
jgi:hypothetical protein